MRSHLLTVVLTRDQLEFVPESPGLYLELKIFFLFTNNLRVLGLTLISLIYLDCIFGKTQRLLVSFFVWTSSFPSTICWRDCLSTIVSFWHLCKIQKVINVWIYIWTSYQILLACVVCDSITVLLYGCVVSLEVPPAPSFCQDCLSFWGSSVLPHKFKFCFISV